MRFAHLIVLFVLAMPAHAQQCTTNDCAYTGPVEPPRGPLVVSDLPVLVMNVFGQKPFFELDGTCQARLARSGQMISDAIQPYAIIGLNEVHPDYVGITCDGEAVIDAIQKNGEYGSGKHRWGHPETDWTSYDGGLALLSTSEFEWSPYKRHVHKYDFDPSGRTPFGFIFAEIELTPDVAIDVYVTHLHSQGSWPTKCDRDCRYQDLEELARGIHERSKNSGNPVLVMGDFNIAGPNPSPGVCNGNCGYSDIMDVLRNPRDLWSESNPTGPGSTNSVDLPASVGKRIDFMFVMSDPFFYNSKYEIFLSRNVREPISLVQWTMDDGAPVSDHFGISAILDIREKVDLPPQCPAEPEVPQSCGPEPGNVIE